MVISPITNNFNFYAQNWGKSPISFGCRPKVALTINALRDLKRVTCLYCGQKMLTNEQIEEYAAKASKLKGNQLSLFLDKLRPDMKPNEQAVVDIIKPELKKNPKADIKDALMALFPHYLKNLEQKQKSVLKHLSKVADGFCEHDRDLTKQLIKKGYEKIKLCSTDKHFKNNKYLSGFYVLKDQYQDKSNLTKIAKAIKSLPTTYTSLDAFVVKYSRKTSKETAERLLMPSVITVEHLNPRSMGGKNVLKNVAAACGRCNSTRRSQPMSIMYDGLKENFPTHVRTLTKELSKKLPKFEFSKVGTYIKNIRKTINSLLDDGMSI